MAHKKWIDVLAYYHDQNMSGESNSAQLTGEVEDLDTTTLVDQARRHEGGIAMGGGSMSILRTKAAEPLATLFEELGENHPISIVPTGSLAAVGDLAGLLKALHANFQHGGEVGQLEQWDLTLEGDSPLIIGQVASIGAKASSGSSAGVNLGAVALGKRLWVAHHLIAFSGTSLAGVIESDATDSWAGGETTRITLATLTGTDSDFKFTDGQAITDPWFRHTWTLSGGGSATILTLFGIY